MDSASIPIHLHASAPPFALPAGHVGPLTLPGTQREIWWTGRVAIGLRFERQHTTGSAGQSAEWVQQLLLERRRSNLEMTRELR